MQVTEVSTKVVPLPVTREEMVARKTLKAQPTLNDYVDSIHVQLWEEEAYRLLLDATSDEDAVEGSTAIDNVEAAKMIRDYAKENNITYVAVKKLATIVKSLNVVLRRYQMTRKQRSIQIGNESYPAE